MFWYREETAAALTAATTTNVKKVSNIGSIGNKFNINISINHRNNYMAAAPTSVKQQQQQ